MLKGKDSLKSAKPLAGSHNELPHTLITPVEHSLTDLRILLVEDNRINQAVVQGILNNIGVQADVAGNGIEAINMLKGAPSELPYDIVLMDCQMPEMDGYQATRAIRDLQAGQRYKDIVIIAMTANAMKGDKEKCLEAGMSDYIAKPVNADLLYERIIHWMINDDGRSDIWSTDADINTKPKSVGIENAEINGKGIEGLEQESDAQDIVWDQVGLLKRVRDNRELAASLVDMFVNDSEEMHVNLCQAIEDEQLSEITAAAHKLKGTSKNLGGIQLGKITEQIESYAKLDNMAEIKQLKSELSENYLLLIEELKRF